MTIEIHKEEIIDLSERIQVKVIYEYRDSIILNKETLHYEFKIKGQNWRPKIKIDLKTGVVSTSSFYFDLSTSFYFDLSTFNKDFKTIADYYATLDLSEENLKKIFNNYKNL